MRKLLSGGAMVIAATAAVLGISAGNASASPLAVAQGAHAASKTKQPETVAAVVTVPQVIQAALSLYQQYAGHGLTLKQATQQILAAIDTAKTEIIAHVDLIATAEAKACTRAAIIDFADIEQLSTDNKQAFARDATACVTRIDSLLSSVTDPGAVDQLGFALNALAPIALTARSHAELSNTALRDTLVHAEGTVTSRLLPACKSHYREGMFEWVSCIAYNGDRGRDDAGVERIALANAIALAMANTSWAVADVAEPILKAL